MSEATVTRETLEKGVAENTAHLEGLRAALRELEGAIPEIMAGGDFDVIASHGGKIKETKSQVATAENRLRATQDSLNAFAITERFNATTEARSAIDKWVFDNVSKKPPTTAAMRFLANVKLVEGNFVVESSVMLAAPDLTAINAALTTMFNADAAKQAFVEAGATEMEIECVNLGKPDATSATRLSRKLMPKVAAPRTPGAGATKPASNGDRSGKLTYRMPNGETLSSYELVAYVANNQPEIVAQHVKAFENFEANGAKMFGMSNLAKILAPKLGAEMVSA